METGVGRVVYLDYTYSHTLATLCLDDETRGKIMEGFVVQVHEYRDNTSELRWKNKQEKKFLPRRMFILISGTAQTSSLPSRTGFGSMRGVAAIFRVKYFLKF